MASIKLGNVTMEVADAATATAIQTHVDGLTEKVAQAQSLQTRADAAAGELAAAKATIDTLKADHAAAIEAVKADAIKGAHARVALEAKVKAICGADWKADGKSDRDCHLDALKALKVEVAADASDEYLRAALDFAPKGDTKPRTTTAALFSAGLQHADSAAADGPKRMTFNDLSR